MKKLFFLVVAASLSSLSACSPTLFGESSNEVKPDLPLVAPNGVRLASSMPELMVKTRPTLTRMYGPSVNYSLTKITFDKIDPVAENQPLYAVARIVFRTTAGQTGTFVLIKTPDKMANL